MRECMMSKNKETKSKNVILSYKFPFLISYNISLCEIIDKVTKFTNLILLLYYLFYFKV